MTARNSAARCGLLAFVKQMTCSDCANIKSGMPNKTSSSGCATIISTRWPTGMPAHRAACSHAVSSESLLASSASGLQTSQVTQLSEMLANRHNDTTQHTMHTAIAMESSVSFPSSLDRIMQCRCFLSSLIHDIPKTANQTFAFTHSSRRRCTMTIH